ncbi:MAG: hypothetical protein SGJ20_20925, partial [Planctomycetota bacterium]|nr:hypothetical protein [Planctomycetota bacterium]
MPPIEPIIDLLLQVILPATVAAGLVLFALRTLCNQQYADLQVAIALIAGLLVGNYYPGSFDYLPVSFGWPWLLAVAVLLLIYSATMNQVSNRLAGSRRIALRLGVLLLAIGLACYATMPEELRTPSWIVGYCVLALADTAVLENQSLRRAGSHVPYAWGFILLTGTALVMICAGTARIADLAFFGLAALTGVWFASVRSPANLAVASLSLGIT